MRMRKSHDIIWAYLFWFSVFSYDGYLLIKLYLSCLHENLFQPSETANEFVYAGNCHWMKSFTGQQLHLMVWIKKMVNTIFGKELQKLHETTLQWFTAIKSANERNNIYQQKFNNYLIAENFISVHMLAHFANLLW